MHKTARSAPAISAAQRQAPVQFSSVAAENARPAKTTIPRINSHADLRAMCRPLSCVTVECPISQGNAVTSSGDVGGDGGGPSPAY
jgi:hypothetical protein